MVTVADLELPPGTVVRPVGNIGSHGIFLGITGEGWWLLGLDVATGERLFGPVRLSTADDAAAFNCFVNGPPNVLCVRQAGDPAVPATAWVIDTESGALSFEGPAEVQVAPGLDQPRLEQVGDFAVATVTGRGIHGVGARGELTWFVPGDGILPTQFTTPDRDIAESTLAVQGAGVADVVFSVADGGIVWPELPQDVQLGQAVVYPGGFGYEYTSHEGADQVAFFDDSGQKLSEPESGGTLETRSLDVPMVGADMNDRVFTLGGRQLLRIPPSIPMPWARLIGSRLFVANDSGNELWQQFDLHTGEAGKTCEGESLGVYYIASDGEVAVASGDGSLAQAVDLTTCETLWSIPGSEPGEAREVWKVDATLVQRSDDRLFSLVAPD